MKTFKLILLAFVAVLGTSCGDDDVSFAFNSDNFVGTYQMDMITGTATEVEQLNSGQSITTTYTISGDTFNNTRYNFNADGTYTITGNYRQTIVTRVGNAAPVTETEIADITESGTYTIDTTSRTVTLTDEFNDVYIADLNRFTATQTWLEVTESEVDTDYTFNSSIEVRLVRI
jgi:hypothetical protein